MEGSTVGPLGRHRIFGALSLLVIGLLWTSCDGLHERSPILTADVPLHLEEHLDAAVITGSEAPPDLPQPVEWRFDELQPDWQPLKPIPPETQALSLAQVGDALRLSLAEPNRYPGNRRLIGAIFVELPEWSLEDWGYVEIRARTRDPVQNVGVAFNCSPDDPMYPGGWFPFYSRGEDAYLIRDGSVRTYRIQLNPLRALPREDPWTHLGIWVSTNGEQESAVLDLISLRVVPRGAEFGEDRVGIGTVLPQGGLGSDPHRRVLYTHSPGRITYRVRIPERGRLDVGVGTLSPRHQVTFRVLTGKSGGDPEVLLEETSAEGRSWIQRSVDLSHLAGLTVRLALEAESDRPGTVALWAAPTLTGVRATDRPNIIFYVIDGGGADHMSVYGYNRLTTPNLERLAAEGVLFERAYSNSSWTKPSTMSFMTSLQNSVLGGTLGDSDPIPAQTVTMAEHMHGAGYQTSVLVSNSYAGMLSSLERGVDFIRDIDRLGEFSVSSSRLDEEFRRWRESYPGEPYWVHFQTTDVHWPWSPVAPFAGLFTTREMRERYDQWERELLESGSDPRPLPADYEKIGIDPVAHFDVRRRIYDEAMAHQDYQIGELVRRLKARGEWDRTLLVVAADHAHGPAGLRDPSLPLWGHMLKSSQVRIPLIIVWPGHIQGGQRFSGPVSLIDVLPTLLDLAGLPAPEIMQGRSLAPLLLGEGVWEPRPVILDEFRRDPATGELRGEIAVIEDRWGASLMINLDSSAGVEELRPNPLLVCDLWNDPLCRHSLHEERPDLVEKYTAFLEAQWEAHQALGRLFTPSEAVPLTPEQLETLRALGYIR